jgi:heat-inducible transcriptional repressor
VTAKAQEVLFAIVRSYIETGEPQGSLTISRALDNKLEIGKFSAGKSSPGAISPATIRNIMADLGEEGYLSQPHTSAGRMPTEKAFRAYVNALVARPLAASDSRNLIAQFSKIESFQGRVEHSCRFLTGISNAVGIAAAIHSGAQELEHIELIGLAERRVLIVVVTKDGTASNRVVAVNQQLSSADLVSLRNYINWNFAGWLLGDARREIQRRIEEERAACDAILGHLTMLAEKDFLASDRHPNIHMEGASNLVGLDLHLTRERMRDLFRTLEEKKRVAELLDRFLDGSSGLGIQIGLAEAHPSMKELALVGVTVQLPGGLTTRVAVLGPLRMNYGRIMSAVLEIGRAFERVQAT